MDNIWIFLVIIGAVISIAQKNQQKQRNAESGEEPSLDPQAELERRMREIFGEYNLIKRPCNIEFLMLLYNYMKYHMSSENITKE